MRELVVENQEILMIPQNFRFANKGKVTSVQAGDFTLELEYEPDGILKDTYCEFYTQTSHGKLYFDSYAKEINGKTLVIGFFKDVSIHVLNILMNWNYVQVLLLIKSPLWIFLQVA